MSVRGDLLNCSVFSATLGAVLLGSAFPSLAQTAPSAQQSGAPPASANPATEIQEVIVTASKREQSIEKTPIAMSALTQKQLANAGVTNITNLTAAVPNVQIETYPFTGAIFTGIRGIISKAWSETDDPDVPIYIDGVVVPRAFGLGSAFYDLSRVETLRGPQGTLYGKDAATGAVNVITASPEQRFGAEADVGYGNYGDVSAHAMVNLPINDTFAVRVSAVIHENDGYFKTKGTNTLDTATPTATTRDGGAIDEYGGRISALWQPTSNFKWRLTVDDFISNNTETPAIATGANGQPLDGFPIYNRAVPSYPQPTQNITNFMVRSRMDWQVSKDLTLSYIAGMQHDTESYSTEVPTANTFFDAAAIGYSASWATYNNTNMYQEVDLNYSNSWIKNILGFSYAQDWTASVYNNQFLQDGFNLGFIEPNNMTSDWGVFDQATVNVTNKLRLTGGLRYSSDYKTVGDRQFVACPVTAFIPGSGALPGGCSATPWPGHLSGSATTWKAGLEYDVTDRVMSYVTVSTGYKAGGINITGPGPFLYYRPENVTNYEGGIKGRYLDGRATLNADFFYSSYQNIDVDYLKCGGAILGCNFFTANAAQAAIWGPELDGSFNITDSDRIEGYINYLHATYTNYPNVTDPFLGTTYANLNGHYLPNAPQVSLRVQYSHDFLLPNGAKLTPMAAVYWQSVSYLREFNLPLDTVPAYSKTSLRLTYVPQSGHWEMQAYVDNLENHAVRVGDGTYFDAYASWYGAPRTFGVKATYRY